MAGFIKLIKLYLIDSITVLSLCKKKEIKKA